MKRIGSLIFPCANKKIWLIAIVLGVCFFSGCGKIKQESKEKPVLRNTTRVTQEQFQNLLKAKNPEYSGKAAVLVDGQGYVSAAELRGQKINDLSALKGLVINALDLRNLPILDVSALEGMPLEKLFLEDTEVKDISALRAMPLVALYIGNTKVSDISPLAKASLVELNLFGCPVTDISVVRGMPLKILWLNSTLVSDISALALNQTLVSLTLHNTAVSDLTPLMGTKLQRLHIGQTQVTDLTPLKDLQLTRLVFTPSSITKGIEDIRKIPSLQQLGTEYKSMMPAKKFWKLYDKKKLK